MNELLSFLKKGPFFTQTVVLAPCLPVVKKHIHRYSKKLSQTI